MKLKLTSIAIAIATTALFSSQSFADVTSFTRLISIGDSSSDGGAYSNAIRAADPTMPNINYKLTTNFSDGSAKVAVEYLSDKLGTSITNYAQGGAFVASPSAFASPSVGLTAISVKDQIDLMLTQSPTLNSKDIAVFWAGFNNINNAILFTAIPNNLSQSSVQGATAQVTQAANDYATQIIRVKNAGAGLVLINGVSNLGQVPLYVNNFPQASNLAKNLSIDIFNGTLKKNLVGSNILYVDTAKLLNAMVIDPSRFGFTATNASTTSYPGLTYSSLANSTLLGQAIGYTSAANKAVANSYLFTDIGHPTDAAHLIYSQLDFSVIQSVGQQASMLFAPSYAVRQANSDIEPHLSSLALMRGANLNTDTRPLGDNQFWFSGGSNGFDSNSNQITPSFSSHTTTGTIGLDRMIASNALLGGAFSYSNGHSKFGSGSGEYDSHLSLGSLYATVSLSNNFYMNSTLQYGDIRQDRIYRTVFLGPTSITSIGKTSGSYEAIRIGFGHIDNYGSWSITPSVSISLAKTKLKAYSESETPVSLAYGDASYKSNFGTFAIAAQMNGSKDVWLPFFKMSIDRDRSNKPMTVGVGPDSSLIANISIDKPIRTFYTGNAGIQRIFDGGSLSIQGSATAGSALSNKGYGLSATYKLAI